MHKGIIFNISNEGFANRIPGAHRIATELRNHNWDIEVIDFVQWWTPDELTRLLNSRIDNDTKFIGFSSVFSAWNDCAEMICMWVKERYPDIKVLYGSGTFKTLKTKLVDYYMVGYSDVEILNLLKYLFSNGEAIPHNVIKGTKVIKSSGAAPWKNPLIIYEDRDFIESYEWLGIEFSRGCKFACAYCNFPHIGVKGDWTRDSDNVEYQLKDAYDRFGTTRYMVSDETFNDSVEKITKFANVVDTLNFEPFFTGFLRADLAINRGVREWEELSRMKFYGHFYGIETFNYKTGKAIGKGMDPEKVKQGLIDIKNYFRTHNDNYYRGTIALVAGLPYDTEENVYSNYEWLKENWNGESYLFNVLDIPPKEIYESLNGDSKITLDFEKFGYSKIAETSDMSTMMSRDTNIIWKNEHTDFYRMFDIVEKIYDDIRGYDFKFNNWEIAFANLDIGLTELLNCSQNADTNSARTSLVRNYIDKKLNI